MKCLKHYIEPLLPLRIVAIAHTNETVTILREQLLRAFVPWFEMQKRAHNANNLPPSSARLKPHLADRSDWLLTEGHCLRFFRSERSR